MRLLRFETDGRARIGVLRDDRIVPLPPLQKELPTVLSIIEGGPSALQRVKETVQASKESLPLDGVRLLAPIEKPGKYLAIGMNYKKHVEESARAGVSAPSNQMWFNKQTTCLSGPYDPIDPGVTTRLDYEAELGVVIGRKAKGVSAGEAKAYVFGYFVANDVSARDWQFHSPTFTVGKSFDTHGPIGPWIVTADEIEDPHDLSLRCYVNGELRQDSNTSNMIYDIWSQIAYLSTAFTLEPGDLLATGTPEGVGAGMDPPQLLKRGDVVRCEVAGIGSLENPVL